MYKSLPLSCRPNRKKAAPVADWVSKWRNKKGQKIRKGASLQFSLKKSGSVF